MKGRQEVNKKYEDRVYRLLDNAPDLIKDYSYSFQSKTIMTKYSYLLHMIEFNDFLNGKSLVDVRPIDIDRYMEKIKYNKNNQENGASIRATKLFAISNFYKFLVKNNYVEKNPCLDVEIPKDRVEREIIAMTPGEINIVKKNIINGCGTKRENARRDEWKFRDLAILMLGCSTGMRVSEIVEINIEDIDFDNNILISTGKGNKTRKIFFGDSTKGHLLEWIYERNEKMKGYPQTDSLFISNRRQRMSVRAVEKLIANYTKNLDKHITPHKMRSSCATNLLEQTGNIYLVQQQLGHENIETTKRYAKVSESSRRNAANILDSLF